MLSTFRAARHPAFRFPTHASFFSCRNATSAAAAKAVSRSASQRSAAAKIPHRLPTTSTRTGGENLTPPQIKKQYYANKLYEAGQRAIYRAPSHMGLLASSWIISGSCIAGTLALGWLGHWAYEQDSGLPWFVSVAYRLGMVGLTGAAFLLVFRTTRLVSALDLVSQNGTVKLAVRMRRDFPLLRPKQYVVAPYNFVMDRTFVAQIEEPAWLSESSEAKKPLGKAVLHFLSALFFYPFAAFRKLFTLEGIMKVAINDPKKGLQLDTNGKFSNGAEDLIKIATIKD